MVRVLVVFLVVGEVVMKMFCPSDTCVELPLESLSLVLPLDHVIHQVKLGVFTPEATHVRLMELDCNFTWNVVIEGHIGISIYFCAFKCITVAALLFSCSV